MAWKTRPARFNLKLVRSVRKALARGEDCGLEAEAYRLLVTALEAERSELYTINLVHDDEGTYMATCREVPEVLVFEDSEGDAVAAAQTAIRKALAARGRVSDSRSAHDKISPLPTVGQRYPLALTSKWPWPIVTIARQTHS